MKQDMEPTNTSEAESTLLTWQIPSHEHREHGFNFFVWIIAFMVILLLFSIWQKNFLFGIFVILAAGTLLFLSLQHPDTHEFSLTSSHIIFGNYQEEYSYDELSHFHIQEYSDTDIEIFFAFRNKKHAPIHMRIYKGDKEKIVAILREKKLTQKEIEISLFESVSKILGI